MADVTILAEDAEQLVREGGVVNRGDGLPVLCHRTGRALTGNLGVHTCDPVNVKHTLVKPPFAAEVMGPCPGCESLLGSHTEPAEVRLDHGVVVGTVVVTAVRHQCEQSSGDAMERRIWREGMCHPEDESGVWRWTVEPAVVLS